MIRASAVRSPEPDAHDVYRLLRAFETPDLAATFGRLLTDGLCGAIVEEAVGYLDELFGTSTALGAVMAGRAEEGVGDPEQVALAVSILASDLVVSLRSG